MISIINKKTQIKKYIVDIFKLRNSLQVRKSSINKKKIIFSNHKLWFEKKIKSKNFRFNVILIKGIFCGYMNSEKKALNHYYLSWAIKKKFRRKKIANFALNQITKFKNKKYIAYILKRNSASINLVVKNNFKKKKLKSSYLIYQKN